MEHENNPMTKIFPVASISREDLMHPSIGFTMNEARMVSEEQMMEIARRLGRNASNQIVKSSIKLVADAVIGSRK
jgi:hypothetical protein